MAINRQALQAAYDDGLTDREAAQRVGCACQSVFRWRKRNGLRPNGVLNEVRARELYDAGCNDTEIGRQLGRTQSAIWSWRTRNGLPSVRSRPRDWIARALELERAGLSRNAIAAHLQLSRGTVHGALYRLRYAQEARP